MYKYILTLAALISLQLGYAQLEDSDKELNLIANNYVLSPYEQDFDAIFNTDESKQDYKKLREYLSDKKRLRRILLDKIEPAYGYNSKVDAIEQLTSWINKCENYKLKIDDSDYEYYTFYIQFTDFHGVTHYYDSYEEDITINYLDSEIIPQIERSLTAFKNSFQDDKLILSNVNKIGDDISACEERLEATLAPEYKDQEFRSRISMYFTFLIGVLLVGFFAIIFIKSDKSIGRDFLTGHGLQFISLFVLIIAVILFGILGVLEGKELTAILSGISGYILGKGVGARPAKPAPVAPQAAQSVAPELPVEIDEDEEPYD